MSCEILDCILVGILEAKTYRVGITGCSRIWWGALQSDCWLQGVLDARLLDAGVRCWDVGIGRVVSQ